jgi:hypothetical protein
MELKFTVEVDKYDEIAMLEEEIIDRAANSFIEQVVGCSWDKNELYDKLEEKVVRKLEDIMDTDFKNLVAIKVTDNLTKKFERTKQYKILKANEEVESDSLIKSGLKDLIAEIVRSEMKKVFK